MLESALMKIKYFLFCWLLDSQKYKKYSFYFGITLNRNWIRSEGHWISSDENWMWFKCFLSFWLSNSQKEKCNHYIQSFNWLNLLWLFGSKNTGLFLYLSVFPSVCLCVCLCVCPRKYNKTTLSISNFPTKSPLYIQWLFFFYFSSFSSLVT